ncbi:uncharacterized protein N7482_006036 [Penicillium canariense]|uniref:Uncharacterized protein n=1 Tax=Penicillium canariense TaxID=189055 RepID=A0A9W9I607_9EURO|nr:uncharacterized protein N7482_006036 [Penicillium canariense]KAJ5167255.1 hypothetical protein N7482_006036 [Penicillium canariense]
MGPEEPGSVRGIPVSTTSPLCADPAHRASQPKGQAGGDPEGHAVSQAPAIIADNLHSTGEQWIGLDNLPQSARGLPNPAHPKHFTCLGPKKGGRGTSPSQRPRRHYWNQHLDQPSLLSNSSTSPFLALEWVTPVSVWPARHSFTHSQRAMAIMPPLGESQQVRAQAHHNPRLKKLLMDVPFRHLVVFFAVSSGARQAGREPRARLRKIRSQDEDEAPRVPEERHDFPTRVDMAFHRLSRFCPSTAMQRLVSRAGPPTGCFLIPTASAVPLID